MTTTRKTRVSRTAKTGRFIPVQRTKPANSKVGKAARTVINAHEKAFRELQKH